ncbi:S24 family peptidase [Herbaspirillum sp. CAH-3]|uniref:LexA family transcriptional regulator n=1 Tax=Herbaspirillum sp. CAH-3 TaxID=2605746 RepID=UPI0012AC6375|nr:S24 family peptidase [Herbaspirillum sp. CAH-3]MRT30792.1 helix-turn-helix transcriptional regulator [Herbaspirillum sp. CAH-3]
MNTLAERLQAAFERRPDLTQSGLAKACGIKAPSVADWLSGRTKKIEGANLLLAAQFLDVNPWWLATGKGQIESSPNALKLSRVHALEEGEEDPRFVPIRTVKLQLQAGVNGIALDKSVEDGPPLYMPRHVVQRHGYIPGDLIAIKVRGGSMEPTLYEDDIVVINTADKTIKDNQVYAVNYEGEDVVKRLVRDNGDWWLSSDNPDQRRYPRKLCRGGGCVVIGRIVYKQSENI